jgi:glycosyltransferase involved in cell wall biosynthesis
MARRARVLHVLKLYRPMFTGEGVFLERCAATMQAMAPGVEHDLLVTATPKPERDMPVCSPLRRIFYLGVAPAPAWRHELALLWWFLRNVWRYDTVHVRTHADWYFLTYLLTRLAGRRLVLSATLDDSVPVLVAHYRPALRPLARRLFRLFHVFVSISPRLQGQTARVMDPARCHLLPCGIVLPSLEPGRGEAVRARLGIPPEALVLVFVGGLCERKDPGLLVRELPEILRLRPDTYLLLVGPPLEQDYVASLHREVAAGGIGAHVRFVGEVPDAYPYLQAADIMTFASRLEGFGTVVPEAQAAGLPVVVRRLPGVNDLFVTEGGTGFFFDDAAGYRAAVLRLIADPALRRKVGRQAQERARSAFGMAAIARRYLDVYGFAGGPDEALRAGVPSEALRAGVPSEALRAGAPDDAGEIGTSASILSPRFHAPAAIERIERPVLLTIIDAEEAFDWNRPFSRAETDVTSMMHQEPAQRIFARYGVVPTYMVDYPVATQEAGYRPLREFLADAACDIGTQLHPWVTPPFLEEVTARNSFAGSLPLALEYAKIRTLTEAIEARLGVRPGIYRAGRYGAGPRTADILRRLGYQADSSVMPTWNFAPQNGPDFSALSAAPYWVDAERTLLEIPGSAAQVGLLAGAPAPLRRAVFSGAGEHLGLTSLMARLRLLERIKITPEGITVAEAKRLVRYTAPRGQKVFVLTYHTPSLVPGNTPYVRTPQDLDRFLGWLDEFYDFFTREMGGRCASWRDVRTALMDAPPRVERRAAPALV